jgi:hypothetical protein
MRSALPNAEITKCAPLGTERVYPPVGGVPSVVERLARVIYRFRQARTATVP